MTNRHQSDEGTPTGTAWVVGGFGIAVVVGWLAFFFGIFLPRTTP